MDKVDAVESLQESSAPDSLINVSGVESSEILVLDSGVRVRLLGVKENPNRSFEACEFLRRITANQRVFMKQDKIRETKEGGPLAYVYLEDGRFLNAMLVKYDLVDVDEDTPFKYRERFLKRQRDNRNVSPKT